MTSVDIFDFYDQFLISNAHIYNLEIETSFVKDTTEIFISSDYKIVFVFCLDSFGKLTLKSCTSVSFEVLEDTMSLLTDCFNKYIDEYIY